MHPAVIATALLSGVFGLAIVAVVVAQKAQTPQVIQSAGSALASVIKEAVSPVTGMGNAIQTTQSTTPGQIVSP